jgi:calcineurin-like phosphoesterase family protein
MKTLVIGDIQGCFAEFEELLQKAAPDRVIAVGDLVDRGPDSGAVVKYFQKTSTAESVMGNHEWKHIHSYRSNTSASYAVRSARKQIGEKNYPKAVEYMEALPAFLDLQEAVVIHAFWEPGISLRKQRRDVLIGITSGETYINRICKQPWWELYDGAKPLIVGHHDYSKKGKPLIYKDRVYCIDTGCCYGNALTGLVLPDFRLISIRARTNYWAQFRQKYN